MGQRHQQVQLPVIAAGGIATSADVTAALRAGAVAAMVGTVLLRTQESGPTGLRPLLRPRLPPTDAARSAWSHMGPGRTGGATPGASIHPSAIGSWSPLA
ncbi:nitronate monooxygenase [Streptomyces sp. NPDC048484]|uniref:nitronate monooxygenase n=1 Tax=Streptomyces sp. NPDC048484 TaxID=3155146 RepID=UPI003427D974